MCRRDNFVYGHCSVCGTIGLELSPPTFNIQIGLQLANSNYFQAAGYLKVTVKAELNQKHIINDFLLKTNQDDAHVSWVYCSLLIMGVHLCFSHYF